MTDSLHEQLSRRESQIMNLVYEKGEATAEEIRKGLPDPPSNSSVRSMLSILEEKGHLTHHREGRTYVYEPTVPKEEARRSLLKHMVETFFGDSLPEAVATLLDVSGEDLSKDELDQLSRLIAEAQQDED